MLGTPYCVLSLSLLLPVLVNALSAANHEVETRFGLIQGITTKSARGRLIANFLGMPYAHPPIGDLRFRSPVAWETKWESKYYAISDSLMCAQVNSKGNVIGSEDCLYLNVFVPLVSEELEPGNKHPVMVYIHGGAFNGGSSDSNKLSPEYLLDQDVVLVTLNYRLNVLGFFSTANNASAGNFGIKDIATALKWVHENIEDFDGDPNSVTLIGYSAGAAAAHLLALSDATEGLFHRIILHSGSALSTCALHDNHRIRKSSIEMARLAGCRPYATVAPRINDSMEQIGGNETESTTVSLEDDLGDDDEDLEDMERDEEMMECMRTVSAKKILLQNSYYNTIWRGNPLCVFGPTTEEPSKDAVVTMHPILAIKRGLYRNIPMILGVAEDEGLFKSIQFYADLEAEEEMIANFDLYLPYLLEYHEVIGNLTAFARVIEDFYFDGNIATEFRQNVTELVGDGLLTWPIYQGAKLHARYSNSSIYFYRFSYEGTFTSTFRSGIPMHYGVSHGDELNYLFPKLNYEFRDQLLHNTEDDITMINVMTEMWASFATHGVPRAWMTPTWPNFAESGKIMRFGLGRSPDLTVDEEFFPERMAFWENITMTLIEQVEDDNPLSESDEAQQVTDFTPSFHSHNFLLSLLSIITLYALEIR